MFRYKQITTVSCLEQIKEEDTPISTASQLPSGNEGKVSLNNIKKPICIGKLVDKYLKQMDSEERLCKIPKTKRPNKSSHRLIQSPRKTNHKPVTPKKIQSKRKNMPPLIKYRHHNQIPPTKRVNKSTRRRVQTTVSPKSGHSLSMTKKTHLNTSIDAHCSEEHSSLKYRNASEQQSKHSKSARKKTQRLEENPFTIYFKTFRNIRL